MNWLLALFILAGPASAATGDECGAAEQQVLVGTYAPNLTAVTIGREVRIVRPRSSPPQDTNPRRLNIELDAAEIVIAVYCG